MFNKVRHAILFLNTLRLLTTGEIKDKSEMTLSVI